MRARYYNSDIKRFINQDIKVGDIGSSQSLNRYAYCEGNPVNMVDPFGLSPEDTQDQGKESKYAFWHGLLDVAGLVWDGADIVNAALYAMEGNWVMAATSIACALPVIGTAVAGVTKATKLAKAGKVIEKTLQVAGKLYTTIESAKAALELAGDAKMEYAVNGGKMTLGVAAKMVGAVAMAGISMLTAGSLMKDVTSLSKVSNIDMNTKTQQTADAESGKCPKGEGIGCFIAGTKIKTEDGEKNIEDVEAGDYVLAENPETGEQEYKEVVRTYIHEKTAIVHVFVGEEEIETTVEHPFYVEGVGFVSAGELKTGDIIRTSEGKNLPIDKIEIEELEEPVLVYNFEVADFHTYYVSDLGVLVHNTCGDTTVGESGSDTGYKVSDSRKSHILEGEGPTDPGHGPNRGFTEGAFPDTWNDEQVISAIEDVANSPNSTWKQSTGPGASNAPITVGMPDVNAPVTTNKGTPIRFIVKGRNHGLNITVIIEPNGEGIITGYNNGR